MMSLNLSFSQAVIFFTFHSYLTFVQNSQTTIAQASQQMYFQEMLQVANKQRDSSEINEFMKDLNASLATQNLN